MEDDMLRSAVDIVNGWATRPSTLELVKVASCKYCGTTFPAMSTGFGPDAKHGASVCGAVTCQTRLRDEIHVLSREIRPPKPPPSGDGR
jgi:hypothetical protein